MTIKYYHELDQGSDAWFAARCGLLTASEMHLVITAKELRPASNDKSRCHLYELLSQRVNNYVEPTYIGDNMLRGHEDELRAKIAYNEKYAPLQDCGFITNDKWGFTLGYSPDALVGEDGLIECKSRRQKYQTETIINHAMPDDFKIQVQTGLLVSERKWCDFVSYCGGMPMYTLRIDADEEIQTKIVDAAKVFHDALSNMQKLYEARLADKEIRLLPTERVKEQDIIL